MAGRKRWIIVLQTTEWKLIRLRGSTPEVVAQQKCDPFVAAELAQAVAEAMAESGHQPRHAVLLALGTTHCVAASVPVPSAKLARNREAMTYLMEPLMPWSAEDAVVDYERADNHALMVAARLEPLLEMLTAWDEAGIHVASIVPLSRLMVADDKAGSRSRSGRNVLLLNSDDGIDLWMMDGKQPTEWQHVPSNAPAVVRALQLRLLSEPAPLHTVCRGLPAETVEQLTAIEELDIRSVDHEQTEDDRLNGLANPSLRILDGRDNAPIELRRGPLLLAERSSKNQQMGEWLLVSVMVLMICVGAAFLLKAQQAGMQREAVFEQQKTVFREVLPDQKMQQAVRSRLESELKRLKGLKGDGEDVPQTVDAALLLNRMLQALPEDLRFRILEVRIEDGGLNLVGEVRDHSDADTIAAALRKSGVTVTSPQTYRLAERGVGFRISAELKLAASGEGPS